VDANSLLVLLNSVADAVRVAIADVDDWGPTGRREGQYSADLVADGVALTMLRDAGVGILSEESGTERLDADVVVVIDPLDGSTNASRGVPWFAASLCAVDAEGPLVSVVLNLASGDRFEAVRGGGARRNGVPLPRGGSGCRDLGAAFVGCSGLVPFHPGWAQFRSLGASALDLCAVAAGVLDGFLDCDDAHGVWDFAGAWLVCREVGIDVVDGLGRELLVWEHSVRRSPVAAATPELLGALVAARRIW
jgi:fructose-1,6-bisphosphatase/inositol monophosphatase family enzyme